MATIDSKTAELQVKKAAQAQVKLAASADTLKTSAVAQEDSADRRTVLAADRTVLAAERTYAAWMRTGLAALASGIGAKALFENLVPDLLADGTSLVLILFAAFCFVAGVWRQLDRATPPPRTDLRTLPAGVLLAFNGFLVAVCLAVLIGFVLS
jgi:putative membrane protein